MKKFNTIINTIAARYPKEAIASIIKSNTCHLKFCMELGIFDLWILENGQCSAVARISRLNTEMIDTIKNLINDYNSSTFFTKLYIDSDNFILLRIDWMNPTLTADDLFFHMIDRCLDSWKYNSFIHKLQAITTADSLRKK